MLRPHVEFLPAEGRSGSLLPLVIAVMVYLCSLALATGLGMSSALNGWTQVLTDSLTIQIVQEDRTLRDKQVQAALDLLSGMPGIEEAHALGAPDLEALLEPWIGEGNVTADLPVPAMISVTLDDAIAIDMKALAVSLKRVAPDAALDDHQGWLLDVFSLVRAINITAAGIIFLVIFSTIGVVIFGTSAELATHRDWVEIMHLMGAEDSLIADEFQFRYLMHGAKGGIAGLTLALLTIFALAGTVNELVDGLLPSISLGPGQWFLVTLVPVFSAILSTLTARLTVRQALAEMP